MMEHQQICLSMDYNYQSYPMLNIHKGCGKPCSHGVSPIRKIIYILLDSTVHSWRFFRNWKTVYRNVPGHEHWGIHHAILVYLSWGPVYDHVCRWFIHWIWLSMAMWVDWWVVDLVRNWICAMDLIITDMYSYCENKRQRWIASTKHLQCIDHGHCRVIHVTQPSQADYPSHGQVCRQ